MAKGNFRACQKITEKWEGGWSDHPADPGGKTYQGVTQATYNRYRRWCVRKTRSVARMTKAERVEIYTVFYWNKVVGEDLPFGVDLSAHDWGVNSGPRRSVKAMQRVAGVKADGVVGPATLAAMERLAPAVIVARHCDRRLSFVMRLRTWQVFGKGWARRIADVRARGIHWASGSMAAVDDDVEAQQRQAQRDNKTGMGAGGGAALTGPASTLDPTPVTDWPIDWVLVAIGAALLVAAIYFITKGSARRRIAKEALAAALKIKREFAS